MGSAVGYLVGFWQFSSRLTGDKKAFEVVLAGRIVEVTELLSRIVKFFGSLTIVPRLFPAQTKLYTTMLKASYQQRLNEPDNDFVVVEGARVQNAGFEQRDFDAWISHCRPVEKISLDPRGSQTVRCYTELNR